MDVFSATPTCHQNRAELIRVSAMQKKEPTRKPARLKISLLRVCVLFNIRWLSDFGGFGKRGGAPKRVPHRALGRTIRAREPRQ